MGNKDQSNLTQDDLKTTLRKRDEKIARLEAQIDAYIARTSETQARLLTTIDTLHSLKAQHIRDLTARQHEAETLRKEVEQWTTFANTLEFERDDLKDAVEGLILKVEMSSDWSKWPCSHMNITKHLNELPENDFNSGGRTDFDDVLHYSASIITRLRTELDHERKSHCKAVEGANFRISELEARVAEREAMLEVSIRHYPKREKSPLDCSRQPRHSNNDISPPKIMTDEECLRVLANNHSRNKSLESEIRSLARKLEHARVAASPPPLPADIMSLGPSQRSIAQLDDQINTYATQLETFKAERKVLMEVAVRDRRPSNGAQPDFPQILGIEEECMRLTSQVSQLELELEHSRSSAQSREQELLKEINALKLSLCQRSPGLYHAHSAQPLDDGIDAEQNMELATPLQPTNVLSWDDLNLTPPPNGSLMSPLPLSPERKSIVPPSHPMARPPSPHPVKLKRLEEGLEVTGDPSGEQLALGQLKDDMNELQRLLTDKPP